MYSFQTRQEHNYVFANRHFTRNMMHIHIYLLQEESVLEDTVHVNKQEGHRKTC